MAFVYTWDAAFLALPANTEVAKDGASRIRALKSALDERIKVDHSLAGDSNDGKHLQVTMMVRASDPSTVASTGYAYTKAVSAGVIELFYKDAAGNVIQLTTAGSLKGPLVGNVTGNLTGNVTGNVTGNATTATTAATVSTTVASGATGTTQALGTNNTTMATTAYADKATVGGSGQTWQNVTRVSGTQYTNSTGRPIMVKATVSTTAASAGITATIVVGGVTLNTETFYTAAGGYKWPVSFIVPNGMTYKITVTASSGTPSISGCSELR